MKPLEDMWWQDAANLLQHGMIRLSNGWTMQQWPKSQWHENYILRMGEETKAFTRFMDMMEYIVFHGASFHPLVVDAEDAKQERIERHLQKSRERH